MGGGVAWQEGKVARVPSRRFEGMRNKRREDTE